MNMTDDERKAETARQIANAKVPTTDQVLKALGRRRMFLQRLRDLMQPEPIELVTTAAQIIDLFEQSPEDLERLGDLLITGKVLKIRNTFPV